MNEGEIRQLALLEFYKAEISALMVEVEGMKAAGNYTEEAFLNVAEQIRGVKVKMLEV